MILCFSTDNKFNNASTLQVCREYLRNNCDRQECRYAHPPAHVKVENGHVVYCIDHVVKGSCRKGEECRYFHMPRHLALRYGKIDPRGQKRTYDEMRDEERESDEHHHSPRDDDHQRKEQDSEPSEEKKPAAEEKPSEDNDPESTNIGDVKEEHMEKSFDDHFDDHKVEDEVNESEGNILGEEDVQSKDGGPLDFSNPTDPAGSADAEKVDLEEGCNAPGVTEELQVVKDEEVEERFNEVETAEEDRLVVEDAAVLGETEAEKTIEEEAEVEGKTTETEVSSRVSARSSMPPMSMILLNQ